MIQTLFLFIQLQLCQQFNHQTPLPGIKYPSWLPEADIKDFDEFLRNTLNQAGFSSQGLRSSGVQKHLTIYVVFLAPLIATFIFK